MGMLLLLLVLIYPSDLVSLVEPVSSRLIQNLSLLFIPASVGAFFLEQEITSQLPNLLHYCYSQHATDNSVYEPADQVD